MNRHDDFWNRVSKAGDSDCWTWQGPTSESGYGTLYWRGRHSRAHRVSYEITHGRIPGGLHVLHRCDNRPCCNPAHLWLGTHTDNMRDMFAKGRCRRASGAEHYTALRPGCRARGEKNRNSRLTEFQVSALLAEYVSRVTKQRDLARKYGVSQRLVSNIVHNRAWKHVPRNQG